MYRTRFLLSWSVKKGERHAAHTLTLGNIYAICPEGSATIVNSACVALQIENKTDAKNAGAKDNTTESLCAIFKKTAEAPSSKAMSGHDETPRLVGPASSQLV